MNSQFATTRYGFTTLSLWLPAHVPLVHLALFGAFRSALPLQVALMKHPSLLGSLFFFFRCSRKGHKNVPQKLQNMCPKWDPKSEAKSVEWVPKATPKQSSKKNTSFSPPLPECGQSVVNNKVNECLNFRFWFRPSFGCHFGCVLGAQMEAKAIKKPSQGSLRRGPQTKFRLEDLEFRCGPART